MRCERSAIELFRGPDAAEGMAAFREKRRPGLAELTRSGEQAVADAAHGHDQLRVVGLVLDLQPQSPDVRVDEPGVAEVLVPPHPFEQLIP